MKMIPFFVWVHGGLFNKTKKALTLLINECMK